MKQKECPVCKIVKNMADFYVCKNLADNHSHVCRKCTCRINKIRIDNAEVNPRGEIDIAKFMEADSRRFLSTLPVNVRYIR